MARRIGRLGGASGAFWGLLLGAVLLPAGVSWGAVDEAALRARIAAGEFAPALAMARQAETRAERDRWLGQIALAQAQSGNRRGAVQTAGEMSDDKARSETLVQVARQPLGGQGGGAEADFDSLIDLITSTIAPTTWDEVGGPGSIAPFPTGVYVDPDGVLRRLLKEETDGALAGLREASASPKQSDNVRQSSPLRKVSLTRLEKQVQLRQAAGLRPTEAMEVLAGLQRIQYVLVYPQSGDLVLAGPAGDWNALASGAVVSTETGLPVMRLDDLVVLFRHMLAAPQARFGCLITPRQEGLAKIQQFVEESNKRSLRPGERKAWLEDLRAHLGRQDIEVYGLDPRTRAARVMVEADYRMKLVGMGLEPGVPGVSSYLDAMTLAPGEPPPPVGVLRWWFTLDYDVVQASIDRQAFAIRGQGVKVLSENERLTAEGKRIHTGQSEDLNRQFARSFTKHFEALARKYPIYAELRNLAELALVGALLREEDLAGKVGWHLTCFGDPEAYPVQFAPAPKTVDSVVNHRVFHRTTVVAGVSGGVAFDPAPLVARYAMAPDDRLLATQRTAAAKPLPRDAWWWD